MQFSFHAAVAASSSVWIEENDQLPRPHQLDYVSTKSEKIHIISHLFVNFFNRANLMTHLKSIHRQLKYPVANYSCKMLGCYVGTINQDSALLVVIFQYAAHAKNIRNFFKKVLSRP